MISHTGQGGFRIGVCARDLHRPVSRSYYRRWLGLPDIRFPTSFHTTGRHRNVRSLHIFCPIWRIARESFAASLLLDIETIFVVRFLGFSPQSWLYFYAKRGKDRK